jgi:hypothetical protein
MQVLAAIVRAGARGVPQHPRGSRATSAIGSLVMSSRYMQVYKESLDGGWADITGGGINAGSLMLQAVQYEVRPLF